MRKSYIISLAIVLVSFGLGVYFYPQLPVRVASHWNSSGQVNGYLSRFWGAFLMPIITLVIFAFLVLIPKIDPLKENIKKFRRYFDIFVVLISAYLLYIYAITLAWNYGARFDLSLFIIPALAVLFYYSGVMIEKAKRNWFIGIRTPWTISNEEVWNRTNRLGGRLFKIAAVISLFGLFFRTRGVLIAVLPILAASLYSVVYSYFVYRKIKS